MADNKRFLDSNGVAYLWEKINLFFSQIGHRHETSDVNGLDEYMEENAKAIRDTKLVVEELSELPLYPSEEQVGNIYAYDGKLYRGKKLPKLVLDFSQIEGDGEGNVTQEIIRDFINKNGMNIVMVYDNGNHYDFECGTFEKYNNGLYIDGDFRFLFEERNISETFNHWNSVYVKSLKITAQSPYNEETEEVWQGCVEYTCDDYQDYTVDREIWLNNEYPPAIQTGGINFPYVNEEGGFIVNLVDYISINTIHNDYPFTLLKLELELVTCNSPEDYEEGIFHDFLVWEEVSEEELPIEDTTPATEDTRKRFYREIENNNIYVTDAEYSPGAGGFVIDIVHPKTGGQINDTNELRGYIDPSEVWTNGVNGIEQIYADNRYWLNDLGERVTITPIRMGTNNSSASICLSTKTDVDLYFSPYISMSYPSQEAVIEQNYTTIEVDDSDVGETNEYEVEIFDNINLLNEKWTIVHVPASPEVYINTNRRCYLHKIVKKGEGEGDKYYWSQIAKIQDIDDRINALPEVARTGSYTDLFNKPCIGDVQIYDWPNDEDLPIIEEGHTDSCDNRLKQLLRRNNSLYTAVHNDSGLTLDLREYSRDYKTQGYCGNSLRNFIFQDRIDIASAAYEDYYVSGNNILIQNTKGRGIQLGTSNNYGNVLLAMRDDGDNKRFLFNEVEVNLQSWNGPDSDIKDYTTDNANIYIEIGTSECVSSGWELFKEGELKPYDAYIRSTNGTPTDVFINILDNGYTNVMYNGGTYRVIRYDFISNIGAWLLDFDKDISTVEGEYVTFVDHETPGTGVGQILTPQKTENVWFKRYSHTEVIWEDTEFSVYLDDYYYDENYGQDVCVWQANTYDIEETIHPGDNIKIGGVEVSVFEVEDVGYPIIKTTSENPSWDEWLTIALKETVNVNNPVLKETVKLTGTNCDYIKIWTQYNENPEQDGRRCIVKGIAFNNLKYEYDPNPKYNRDIYKKDYWKQISGSGSGSIKVIDLTGDESVTHG